MRTKTLLLTAALSAAGIATSMAQATSVNAVGYVNVSITKKLDGRLATFALLTNPLNGTNNLLSTIIPAPPDLTTVYAFRGSPPAYEIYLYAGVWFADTTLNPGEGFFLSIDNAGAPNPTTITFVGEVPQGSLSNPIPPGFSIRGSQVPQAGPVSTLNLVPVGGDSLYLFNRTSQEYDVFFAIDATTWFPSEPSLQVAESFFYDNESGANINWTRNFSVN